MKTTEELKLLGSVLGEQQLSARLGIRDSIRAASDGLSDVRRIPLEATSFRRMLGPDLRGSAVGLGVLGREAAAPPGFAEMINAARVPDSMSEIQRVTDEATSLKRMLGEDLRGSVVGLGVLEQEAAAPPGFAEIINAVRVPDGLSEIRRVTDEATSLKRVLGEDLRSSVTDLGLLTRKIDPPSFIDIINRGINDRFAEIRHVVENTTSFQRLLGEGLHDSLAGLGLLAREAARPSFADLMNAGVLDRFAEVRHLAEDVTLFEHALTSDFEVHRTALAGLIDPVVPNRITGIARMFTEAAMSDVNPTLARIDLPRSVADRGLIASPSFYHLVRPCPTPPLIVCARCGQEMVVLEERLNEGKGVAAYPRCECVVVDWAELVQPHFDCRASTTPAARRRRRPNWFRGTFRGGSHGNGVRAGFGILRVVRGKIFKRKKNAKGGT